MSKPDANKRVTQQMLECARLQATGEYTLQMLADTFGKSLRTISRWLANDEVKAEYREILRASEGGIVAKARQVIERSMHSDAANGYLALNAAQTALAQFGAAAMGEQQQQVVVTITGGMPDIGMPQQAEEGE
jgi:hypothetical protein